MSTDGQEHLDTVCPTCGAGRNEETADLYARLAAARVERSLLADVTRLAQQYRDERDELTRDVARLTETLDASRRGHAHDRERVARLEAALRVLVEKINVCLRTASPADENKEATVSDERCYYFDGDGIPASECPHCTGRAVSDDGVSAVSARDEAEPAAPAVQGGAAQAPCPFCGVGTALSTREHDTGHFTVICLACGCEGPRACPVKADAHKEWNRRAPTDCCARTREEALREAADVKLADACEDEECGHEHTTECLRAAIRALIGTPGPARGGEAGHGNCYACGHTWKAHEKDDDRACSKCHCSEYMLNPAAPSAPAAPQEQSAGEEPVTQASPETMRALAMLMGEVPLTREALADTPMGRAVAAAEARGAERATRAAVAWLDAQRDRAWGVAQRDADRGRYDLAAKYQAEGGAYSSAAGAFSRGDHLRTADTVSAEPGPVRGEGE